MSGNGINGDVPPPFGHLFSLRQLDLSNNDLVGTIPRELSYLTGLEELSLASNSLSGDIPPELGMLVGLEDLHLSWNRLTGEIPRGWDDITGWVEWKIIAGNSFTGCIPYGMNFAPGDPGDSKAGDLPFCKAGHDP